MAQAQDAATKESLYKRMGLDKKTMDLVVQKFYANIMAYTDKDGNKSLVPYFKNTKMIDLQNNQSSFLTIVFGGTPDAAMQSKIDKAGGVAEYLTKSHKHYNIAEKDFNAVGECLVKTLTDLKIDQKFIDEIMAIVVSVKSTIVADSNDKPKESLYKRMGLNDEVMGVVVKNFYDNIMAYTDKDGNKTLVPYFKSTKMIDLKKNQSSFLTIVFGGKADAAMQAKIDKAGGVAEYLTNSHKKLNIKEADFNAVGECLVKTLKDLKIDQKFIDEIMAIVVSVKSTIVADSNETPKPSLYERMGLNDEVMGVVVKNFYDNIMAYTDKDGNKTLVPYFKSTKMIDLQKNQSSFLTIVFGGKADAAMQAKIDKAGGVAEYLTNSHKRFNIKEADFNAVGECLVKTLTDLKIDQKFIDEIMAIVVSVKSTIVAKESLYNRMGLNDEVMAVVVKNFYDNIMAYTDKDGNKTLVPYFKSTKMIDLQKNQSSFLTIVFGGKADAAMQAKIDKAGGVAEYLTNSHKRFNIKEADFNAVGECLVKTLKDLKIDQKFIDEIMAIVVSVKSTIVASSNDKDESKNNDNSEQDSLYDRIGLNEEVMAVVVSKFYDNIMAYKDDNGKKTLAPYFKNTKMIDLKKSQSSFLTIVFGGKLMKEDAAVKAKIEKAGGVAQYLTDSHKKFNISEKDFNAVGECLAKTLKEVNVDEKLIDEVMSIVVSVKGTIVNEQSK